jgi:hypothetical protein
MRVRVTRTRTLALKSLRKVRTLKCCAQCPFPHMGRSVRSSSDRLQYAPSADDSRTSIGVGPGDSDATMRVPVLTTGIVSLSVLFSGGSAQYFFGGPSPGPSLRLSPSFVRGRGPAAPRRLLTRIRPGPAWTRIASKAHGPPWADRPQAHEFPRAGRLAELGVWSPPAEPGSHRRVCALRMWPAIQ